uniref:ORF4 n=1 Tax=Bougainvillea chlorotic vein banding virus TaxID=263892 RepID=A0A4V1GQH3_9VIRU|nr:ORF4 [Bougainvillea chlorotic vein banding virus]
MYCRQPGMSCTRRGRSYEGNGNITGRNRLPEGYLAPDRAPRIFSEEDLLSHTSSRVYRHTIHRRDYGDALPTNASTGRWIHHTRDVMFRRNVFEGDVTASIINFHLRQNRIREAREAIELLCYYYEEEIALAWARSHHRNGQIHEESLRLMRERREFAEEILISLFNLTERLPAQYEQHPFQIIMTDAMTSLNRSNQG